MDYKVINITPKLKSEIKQKGKTHWFYIVDDRDGQFTCYNRYLYDAFELGKEVKVRIAQGKRSVIVDVIGFEADYPPNKSKPPLNKAEAEFFSSMESEGWELTKKGWPDFACFKDGKLVLIEVKPKRSHRLKYWQHQIMFELVKHGIRCYRWSPDGGFEPVLENIKFPIDLRTR